MTVTTELLVDSTFIAITNTSQFTSVGLTIIDAVTITNIGTADATVSLNLIPSGGSASTTNKTLSNKVLRANDSYLCPEVNGQVLNNEDFLSAICDIASAVNIRISGRVVTS